MVAVFDTATFLFYLVIISKMETVQTKNPHTLGRQTSECEDSTFHQASNGKDDKKIQL